MTQKMCCSKQPLRITMDPFVLKYEEESYKMFKAGLYGLPHPNDTKSNEKLSKLNVDLTNQILELQEKLKNLELIQNSEKQPSSIENQDTGLNPEPSTSTEKDSEVSVEEPEEHSKGDTPVATINQKKYQCEKCQTYKTNRYWAYECHVREVCIDVEQTKGEY